MDVRLNRVAAMAGPLPCRSGGRVRAYGPAGKRSAVRGTWRGHPSPGLPSRHFTCRGGQPRGPTPKRSLRRYAPHAGGGGSPNTSGTTGLVARNIVSHQRGQVEVALAGGAVTLASTCFRGGCGYDYDGGPDGLFGAPSQHGGAVASGRRSARRRPAGAVRRPAGRVGPRVGRGATPDRGPVLHRCSDPARRGRPARPPAPGRPKDCRDGLPEVPLRNAGLVHRAAVAAIRRPPVAHEHAGLTASSNPRPRQSVDGRFRGGEHPEPVAVGPTRQLVSSGVTMGNSAV